MQVTLRYLKPQSFPIICFQARGVKMTEHHAESGSMATGVFLLQRNSLLAICKHKTIIASAEKKKKKKSGDLKRKLAMRDRTWDLSAGPSSDAQALPPDVPYWICKISKQVLSKVQTEMKICMHHKIGRVKSNQVNRWGLCQNRWAGEHMLKVSHLAKIIKHTTGAHEAVVLCFQRSALL